MSSFSFSPALPISLPSFPLRAGAQNNHDEFDFYYSPQPPLLPPSPRHSPEYEPPESLASSYFSDTTYRTTLIPSTSTTSASRKRTFSESEEGRNEQPQKRRILASVTSTVSAVVSGVWGIFSRPDPKDETDIDMNLPTPPATPSKAPECTIERVTPRSYSSLPHLDTTTPTLRTSNQRWVMVSAPPPSPPPSSAGSIGSRRSRSRYGAAATASYGIRPHKRSHTWSSSTTSPTSLGVGNGAARRPRTVSLAATKRRVVLPSGPGRSVSAGSGRGFNGSFGEEEDEMDEDLRRWNESLKMMIKEGKEALGAKVEVVYDDDLETW